jgi:WhiB family redox-sensing transcriptional regulator
VCGIQHGFLDSGLGAASIVQGGHAAPLRELSVCPERLSYIINQETGHALMEAMDDTLEFDLLSAPILDERPWAVYAACKGERSLAFFPQNRVEEKAALAICAICPVIDDCLDHALESKERFGIWGGTTERARRKLSRVA